MQEFKKIYDSGRPLSSALQKTTFIISNEEINDIMKIVEKTLENSNILLKGATKTIKNETMS